MQKAATRSPADTPAPSGALRTTPPTSLPGTNGSGGLTWYSPRVCSSSGNETPAACTSTTTPRPGVSMCDGSGSGSSASASAERGPLSSVICTPRTGAGSYAVPSSPGGSVSPRPWVASTVASSPINRSATGMSIASGSTVCW